MSETMPDDARRTLPMGPWRYMATPCGEWIEDAEGGIVIAPSNTDYLAASPEVIRAVLALPALVEAAREVVAMFDHPAIRDALQNIDVHEFLELRAALAQIDGEGRGDG